MKVFIEVQTYHDGKCEKSYWATDMTRAQLSEPPILFEVKNRLGTHRFLTDIHTTERHYVIVDPVKCLKVMDIDWRKFGWTEIPGEEPRPPKFGPMRITGYSGERDENGAVFEFSYNGHNVRFHGPSVDVVCRAIGKPPEADMNPMVGKKDPKWTGYRQINEEIVRRWNLGEGK